MSDPLDRFVDSAAETLALPLAPEWRAAVKSNLAVTLDHGKTVAAFRLPDEAEQSPVFVA